MSTEWVGHSDMEPERYLGPTRYRVRYRCVRCGHQFARVTTKLSGKDPPCPKAACKEALIEAEVQRRTANLAAMLESQTAPAQIGKSTLVKAVDTTAQIVMEDHKLTDLADNIRHGDIAAPKLPPPMQQAVDGFFSGEAVRKRSGLGKRQMDLIGRRAMAGAYRGMALDVGSVIPGQKGEPALRPVRKG